MNPKYHATVLTEAIKFFLVKNKNCDPEEKLKNTYCELKRALEGEKNSSNTSRRCTILYVYTLGHIEAGFEGYIAQEGLIKIAQRLDDSQIIEFFAKIRDRKDHITIYAIIRIWVHL